MFQRIRNLREDQDKSQTELAAMLDMSQTGYSKYETGENDLPTAVLIALAKIYETSVDYILGLTDERKPYPPAKRKPAGQRLQRNVKRMLFRHSM